MPVPEDLPGRDAWAGLKSIGVVISECARDGKVTDEVRYYISSLGVGVKRFAHAVRSHWAVENTCHWSLDINYREDESRVRQRHLGENMSWLYRFTLSLLKQHPGRQSLVMKRRCCGWDENFLLEVLAGAKISWALALPADPTLRSSATVTPIATPGAAAGSADPSRTGWR